ncbi:MAG TPA: hypothetical protein VN962_05960 [Polyangia bacterium]|nr:hypothetical protein [Polyangia bacterium]
MAGQDRGQDLSIPYIDRLGGYDLALAGPYQQQQVTWRVFVLTARHDALQATCDRYLKNGKVRYVPFFPKGLVLLTMLDMQRVTAGNQALGFMHEIDCAFHIPVRADGSPSPRVFMPYVFVNDVWPMTTGRDVFGFRKEIARSFSDHPDDDAVRGAHELTHVDASVIPSPGDKLQRRRVVDIKGPATPPVLQTSAGAHGWLQELWNLLFAAERDILTALLALLRPGNATLSPRVVFLKQLRDTFAQDRAAFQQVFEAAFQLKASDFRGAHRRPADDFEITVQSYASHPIVEELGLAGLGERQATLVPKLVVDLAWDFSLPTPPSGGLDPA